ncbi:hypothetical protein [Thorsellia kenyensis]|uniref:Uncharacterized protein n=1 Tax=Thorsellia kenyensis TaxID=1549888 RepID=A0ABV6CD70_9GAMM
MDNNQIIFELNYHYIWLIKKLGNLDFNKACKQLLIEPELLKIIVSLTTEELNLLCLSEKTIFSWELNLIQLNNLFLKSPYLPEQQFILNN